jgi:hypothetical protein
VSDEAKEFVQMRQQQKNLFSLEHFDIKDVRNPRLEYTGEVPMDFNMLDISKHQTILKHACNMFRQSIN